MPTDNLIDFLLYIAPGFLAFELYRYYFPAKKRNNFTKIAQSIIAAVVIASIVQYIDENFLDLWLRSNKPSLDNTKYTLSLFVGGVVAGYVAVFQVNLRSLLARNIDWLTWLAKEPDSIWQKINSPANDDWAVVYLNDGSIYLGWISEYQADPDLVDQDFILSRAQRVNEDLDEIYIVDGEGVYLNTKDVNKIEFFMGR